ncbi:anaerobic ribonucleoside-triphosphate reductase activating protein [Peptostreptococcus equinus]|uniref:Anaerobic ribonucleoside-triphosphate reductase-activating protein n=1 Tax=Peptostreptococcus equinus TaxID=3003601 RepID=A0ABY7JSJ0_9FIRM|nr:anaerobic ribonucleoside-triphosphate reductase activating protein [Peptostreptococcus sp. CBA3647]WAW15816.1 anaerobic ribonucleoside-triphosphate reductase activating protein [Peptostreptococcus sp. CBA3647]
MRYSKIRKYDVANGPGVRVTLFVTGCTHNCEGCFNKDLQNFSSGDLWTDESKEEILSYLSNEVVVGMNLLGGEPLEQTMDNSLLDLLKKSKELYPNKDIWIWSGDILEDILNDKKKLELLSYTDVLIDGTFDISKRNIKLKYRGSENQRVLDVKKSIEAREPIFYEEIV